MLSNPGLGGSCLGLGSCTAHPVETVVNLPTHKVDQYFVPSMAVDLLGVPGKIAIRRACTDSDVASFRELVLEYYEFLDEDISFQAGYP